MVAASRQGEDGGGPARADKLAHDGLAATAAQVRHRPVVTLHDRLHRVRSAMGLAVAGRAGRRAGLDRLRTSCWAIPQPVFAPISAVGTLAASVGQRLRRTVELIVGVAIGVAHR